MKVETKHLELRLALRWVGRSEVKWVLWWVAWRVDSSEEMWMHCSSNHCQRSQHQYNQARSHQFLHLVGSKRDLQRIQSPNHSLPRKEPGEILHLENHRFPQLQENWLGGSNRCQIDHFLCNRGLPPCQLAGNRQGRSVEQREYYCQT